MLNGGTQLIILAASTELYKGHEFKGKILRVLLNDAEVQSAIFRRHCRDLALFAGSCIDTSPDPADVGRQLVRILRSHARTDRGPALG